LHLHLPLNVFFPASGMVKNPQLREFTPPRPQFQTGCHLSVSFFHT
jgi:hypothetical protein